MLIFIYFSKFSAGSVPSGPAQPQASGDMQVIQQQQSVNVANVGIGNLTAASAAGGACGGGGGGAGGGK